MKTKDQLPKSETGALEQPEFKKLDRATRKTLYLMAIILMTMKNLPTLKVSRSYHKLKAVELAGAIKGIVFQGDPDATTPAYADTVVHGKCDDLINAVALVVTEPTPDNRTKVKLLSGEVLTMADANANYMDTVANHKSQTAGDINAGIDVIQRIGYKVAGKGGGKRVTGIVDKGAGWAHGHEDKSKKGAELHVWEGGATSAKNVPPTPGTTKTFMSYEADGIFNNIPSGTWYAYHHASLMPASHNAKSSTKATPKSAKAKTATMIPSNMAKHPVFDTQQGMVFNYGPWR